MAVPWTVCMGVLLTMVRVEQVLGQVVEGVCLNMPVSADPNRTMPRFPTQFSVEVEAKFLERNMTMYITEHYEQQRNRARLHIRTPNSDEKYYYMNYDTNNLLLVDADNSNCQVSQMSSTKDSFIFGYQNESGYAQLFASSGAMHFGNVNQFYNGTWDVRGIVCDVWVSCQYVDAIQASAQVTWYISRKDTWDIQIGAVDAPLRMVTTGIQINAQNVKVPFNHIYDFFSFEQSVRASDFEVPDGVYCPNRTPQTDHPFPDLPDVFAFVGEINDPYHNQFTYLEEAYDNTSKISVYRFKGDTTVLAGIDEYLEFNDYKTGVSYLIDTQASSCSVGPVTGGIAEFSVNINGKQVRMKTPREFFMDSNVPYQYAGSSTVRQIPAERWVGTTTSAPGYNNASVVVEWYFAAEDQVTWNNVMSPSSTAYRIPLLFRVYIPGDLTSPGYDFHIYYFNVMESLAPLADLVDLSQCFSGAQKKSIRFKFNKTSEVILRANVLASVNAIKNGISLSTGASPIRISNVKLFFNPDSVWVTFDLLDKPPQYNDVVTNDVENDVNGAWDMLQDAFRYKTMTFAFAAGTNTYTLTPDFNSLEQLVNGQAGSPATSSNPYSSGSLAAVGVVMLVVGGTGGGVGGYFFNRRFGS